MLGLQYPCLPTSSGEIISLSILRDACRPRDRLYASLEVLDEIAQKFSIVKTLVTSRDDGDIFRRLVRYPDHSNNSTQNKEDVNRTFQRELEEPIQEKRLLESRVPAGLRDQIISTL